MLTDDIVQELTDLVASCEKLSCYFAGITHSSLGHINIKLAHANCFTACIGETIQAKDAYGIWPSTGRQLYLFAHDSSHSGCDVSNEHCESEFCTEFHKLLHQPVAITRGVLIASLLCKLLRAAGSSVTICNISNSHSDNEMLYKSLLCSPRVQPYTCDQSSVGDSSHCIDVRKYLSENNLIGQKLLTKHWLVILLC